MRPGNSPDSASMTTARSRSTLPDPGRLGGEGSGGPPVLHGFVGDDFVVTVTDTGEEQSHLVWFRGGDPTRRAELGPYESARLADPDSGIVFGVTGWSQSHICGDLFDARQLTPRWSSCDWSPVAISPDGSKVFALPSSRPPVNPSVAVLDADTGEVLMQLTMDGRRVTATPPACSRTRTRSTSPQPRTMTMQSSAAA